MRIDSREVPLGHELEAALLEDLSKREERAIESFQFLGNSAVMEWKLVSKKPQCDGGRSYKIVHGSSRPMTREELEEHLRREFGRTPLC